MIVQSLAGLPAFLAYFCTAIVAVVAYLCVYTRVTPHNEFQLIRDNDPAAAIALGLSLLGFSLPVVSAIAHAANVVDCLIWSMIALVVHAHNAEDKVAGWAAAAVVVGVFVTLILVACVVLWVEHRRGPDDGGSGGGGGGTPPPDRPPPGPSWWPDFEREFSAYVARLERRQPVG